MSDRVTMQIGDVVAGRYRIESMVGQGGFGLVYCATQLPIGRVVALKTVLVDALGHGEGRERFRREAELAQRLEHPNTVRLYDFGETEAGLPFIAWEFLKGRPLDVVLAVEGHLVPLRVARIAAQVLKSLMEAHGLGIVHRDIKPSNVFLCEFSGETDFVKVLDFGIAKNTLVKGGTGGLTPEGAILGTPAYMAPEQVRGHEVSPATDLYALGMVMAELLTGAPPYASAIALDVIQQQIAAEPVPLAPMVLESPLGPVIARATQKRVEDRFESAAQMLVAVEAVVETLLARTSAERSRVNVDAATVPAMGAVPDLAAAPPPAPPSPPAHVVAAPPGAPPASDAGTAATALAMPARPSPTLPGVDPDPRNAPLSAASDAAPRRPRPLAATSPDLVAPPSSAGSSLRVVVIVGGVVALAGAIVAGLAIHRASTLPIGPSARATTPASAPAAPSPTAIVARHFAQLTNKQIRSRIEAAGQTVVDEKPGDPVTQFVLSGTARNVYVVRSADVKTAQGVEQAYVKQGGPTATARDGTCVVHVDLHLATISHSLLEQITR